MDNSLVAVSSPVRTSGAGGWKSAIFIIFVEIAERFAYYGLSGNLMIFFTNHLRQPLAAAAQNVNTWIGVSSLFPLIGAVVADSFIGRYKTILISTIIYLLGMGVLTLSVSPAVSSRNREAVFFTALYVLAVGEGGHKPCVQTFAADQFSEEEEEAKSSFFNWWYLGIVIGATSATFIVIYVMDNISWTLGLSILTATVAVGLGVFLAGTCTYRMEVPGGSPYTRVAQVFVAAVKKRRVDEKSAWGICYDEGSSGAESEGQGSASGTSGLLARTNQFRCLDKASFLDEEDAHSSTKNPWRICTQNQVEEVKLLLRLVPIWLSCLMYTVGVAQSHTFFTKQSSTMDRTIGPHFQIPPASLLGVVGLGILVIVPLYDRIFVPFARKITGHPGGIPVLQRVGIGLFFSLLNMVAAALVEVKRLKVARDNNLLDNPKAVIPMRIWWMLPPYLVSSFADTFVIIGLQQLFYDQMPVALRSLGAGAYLSVVGVGSIVSNALISVVKGVSSKHGSEWLGNNINRAHLDQFYWLLAGLSALNLCCYVWIAKGFVYKKVRVGGAYEEKDNKSMNVDNVKQSV